MPGYHQQAPAAGMGPATGKNGFRRPATIDEARNQARSKFRDADLNRSGNLDPREFMEVLNQLGMRVNYQEALGMFGTIDKNQDGRIGQVEFEDLYCELWQNDIIR